MSRWIPALCLLTVLVARGDAWAQASGERSGFTALVAIGAGVQRDETLDASEIGLAGLNIGVGGFLTDSVALLVRTSTTKVTYTLEAGGDYTQLSRVIAPVLQFWATDRIDVLVGAGFGYWDSSLDDHDGGLGLLVGGGVTLARRGRHTLRLGIEYAPAFTDPRTVHNLSLVVGYQLF